MNCSSIPAEDTLGRHCQPKDFDFALSDTSNKPLPLIHHTAFIPSDDGLSTVWLEYFQGVAIQQQISACVEQIKNNRTVRASHRLALVNVGDLQSCGKHFASSIDAVHDPQQNFACHSLVLGIDPEQSELLNLLATQVTQLVEMHS